MEVGSFLAEIRKVTTVVDGSVNITLNIGGDHAYIASKLLELLAQGMPMVSVGIVRAQ